jgi:hypothetical protein
MQHLNQRPNGPKEGSAISWVEIPGCFWHFLMLEMGKVLWIGNFSDGVLGNGRACPLQGLLDGPLFCMKKIGVGPGWHMLALWLGVGALLEPVQCPPDPTHYHSTSLMFQTGRSEHWKTIEHHLKFVSHCLNLSRGSGETLQCWDVPETRFLKIKAVTVTVLHPAMPLWLGAISYTGEVVGRRVATGWWFPWDRRFRPCHDL